MIYLLRHGETVWNTLGRFQGQKDSPLTERGLLQAQQVGQRLATELSAYGHTVSLHVSPLGRAQRTADCLPSSLTLRRRDEQRLLEVTTGSWDGLTRYEIDTEYPGALDGADAFDWYFRASDGETFSDVTMRVKEWLETVSGPTIAVSHGLTGRIIRGVYLGLSQREMLELPVPQDGFYRLDNGQIALIT